MFQRLFGCVSKKQNSNNQTTATEHFASGVVFTNGTHILAGYQPNKRKPFVSGIGGMKEKSETFLETAFREVFEELFEIYSIPKELFQDIRVLLVPKHILRTDGYWNLVYTFKDLHSLLALMKKHNVESELYEDLPSTLYGLVVDRKLVQKKVEISHLCVLPLVKHNSNTHYVDPCFLDDIPKLLEIQTNTL